MKILLGMHSSRLRKLISWIMTALFPLPIWAADSGGALLHSKGGILVNGAEAVDSRTIFPGDLVEAKPGFVANLDSEGSSVLIQSDSVVEFDGTFLTLDHGSVSVGTSRSLSVHVDCLRIQPLVPDRTQYEVTANSGTVHVAARKSDVNIVHGGAVQNVSKKNAQPATVREGQEVRRSESEACGAALRPPAAGNGLNPKILEIGGGVGAGIVTLCLLLCRGTKSTDMSPSTP